MRLSFAVLTIMLLPVLLPAQKLELKLDALAARASEKTEVDLDAATIAAGLKIAKSQSALKQLPEGVEEIHVRNFEFDKPGAYTEQELEPVRKQLTAANGWSRVLSVKEKKESCEIYVHKTSDAIKGLVVLAMEQTELTVVHLAGAIKESKLSELVNSTVHFDIASLTK